MHPRADLPCQAGSFQRWPPETPGEHTAPRQPRKKGEAKGVELDLEGTIDGSPAPVQTERHWCTTAGPEPIRRPRWSSAHPSPPLLFASSSACSLSKGGSLLQLLFSVRRNILPPTSVRREPVPCPAGAAGCSRGTGRLPLGCAGGSFPLQEQADGCQGRLLSQPRLSAEPALI